MMMPKALIVAQSGGPTPVINATLAGVIQAAKDYSQITHIYGLVNGLEGALQENLIDLGQEPADTLAKLPNTPAAILGSGRYKVVEADYERVLTTFQAHNVRYFVHTGGNGSMYVTHRLVEAAQTLGYELSVIGVPKTMDNDLVGTDHAPGYGSAARFLALATRDTGRDLESMVNFDDVIILETMGRNAGWLAAATAVAKTSLAPEHADEAPHLIYMPETPFDEARFLADVAAVHRRLGRVFVVVCESLRDQAGQLIGGMNQTDPVGRIVPSLTPGVAAYLTDRIRNKLQLQTRFIRPSLIGRSSSACVSVIDRKEALAVGREAVIRLMAGQSDQMITLERTTSAPYRSEIGLIPLVDVAGLEKTMPRTFINEAGNHVTPEFFSYARPLIGELPPLARLRRVLVDRKVVV